MEFGELVLELQYPQKLGIAQTESYRSKNNQIVFQDTPKCENV